MIIGLSMRAKNGACEHALVCAGDASPGAPSNQNIRRSAASPPVPGDDGDTGTSRGGGTTGGLDGLNVGGGTGANGSGFAQSRSWQKATASPTRRATAKVASCERPQE
jgi:hypothetical protein